MRSLIIIAAFIFAIGVKCEMDSNELMENLRMKYLKGYLKEREYLGNVTSKFEALCPGKGIAFEDALEKIKQCGDDIDELTETACSITRNHAKRCFNPVISLLENCLPEESRELPSFIFKSLLSVADYLCKTDGEHIFELANTCIYETSYRTARCERKVRAKMQIYRKKVPSKVDLCEFAQSIKPCLQSHLSHACGSPITRESFMRIFDAATSPCIENNEVELIEASRELLD